MPADILGIRPELHGPGAAAQTRTVSGAIFGRAKRQLSRYLKYIAQTLLKLSFLSSSPTWPAMQSSLYGTDSACGRTHDIPLGRRWSRIGGFAAPVSARHFSVSVSARRRPV